MAASNIGKQLEKAYQSSVQVILQDPCYTEKNCKLLKGLHGISPLSFIFDPDGLPAIDSKTIVMTTFLPVGYPLLQTIADLLSSINREGPAAIICDSMELDPSQKLYRSTDRSSPEVARFLTEHYVVQDFTDHVLGKRWLETCMETNSFPTGYRRYSYILVSRRESEMPTLNLSERNVTLTPLKISTLTSSHLPYVHPGLGLLGPSVSYFEQL